ncbi:glutathione transferase GstA [Enterobacter sp. Ap-916]|uniref:glutathione transferase GstA n=1 Tax=unclassified Enterobacter TaxID=2608935 RepID=UPI00141DB8B4|nr:MULTISPECIES: glutathione transferase GstA [unclassified Enterobacter]NIF60647.1 glutathione transferase GstA [Enterobacter sp. Ap-867]NIG31801.1 glutathione transferase GstA [Enterobacter sp. Ap-916]
MKLYYSPGSCGLSPAIALREACLAFELVKVDFATKTTVEGNYLDVNPKGFIPILVLDNGDLITEGAVILQWIADQNPGLNLLPPFGTQERYRALEWLNVIATDLAKGMSTMFQPFFDDAAKNRYAEGFLKGRFAFVEEHLSNNDYVLGNEFSAPDAYLYNVLNWPPRVGIDMSVYPAIERFMRRMEQRPSVQAARAAEGLPPR